MLGVAWREVNKGLREERRWRVKVPHPARRGEGEKKGWEGRQTCPQWMSDTSGVSASGPGSVPFSRSAH